MNNIKIIEEVVVVQPEVIEVVQYQTIHGVSVGDIDNALLEAHINDLKPHPAYDEGIPSLNLLFENGLV